MTKPLMAKATAVWLVDNTTLTFRQVADFCGMHELEVQGIADGDVATGVKGFDPVANNQLDPIEIERGQKDPLYKPKLKFNHASVPDSKVRSNQTEPAAVPPVADRLDPRHAERSSRREQAEQCSDIVACGFRINFYARFLYQHDISC